MLALHSAASCLFVGDSCSSDSVFIARKVWVIAVHQIMYFIAKKGGNQGLLLAGCACYVDVHA